jgi:hypothetical protein
MGIYLNPGNEGFRQSLRSEIYVDKSGLISLLNSRHVGTSDKYICISRPRRFGKSRAIEMLSAYYSSAEDTDTLFDGSIVKQDPSYNEYRNKYDVIKLTMTDFLMYGGIDKVLEILQKLVIKELKDAYSIEPIVDDSLQLALQETYQKIGKGFVFLIDEWDCILREWKDKEAQKKYLDFLRGILKDKPYVSLAYMTGILPIKKYGTHSTLNMFAEYSMVNAGAFAPFYGFTEEETKAICDRYKMPFAEVSAHYNGYKFKYDKLTEVNGQIEIEEVRLAMFGPKSVVEATKNHKIDNYWNQTETYEALAVYIQMNLEGLKDIIIELMAGGSKEIRISTFSNDLTSFADIDSVLTLLVHLGYLYYDEETWSVRIPNMEVQEAFYDATVSTHWNEVISALKESKKLLEAIWNRDNETVAALIEKAHEEVAILQYNNEAALSYTLGLALYYAKSYYNIIRELPSGKGFIDIAYIPRKAHADKPAMIVELKYDKTLPGALNQIKEKNYSAALKDFVGSQANLGSMLLVAINYDKVAKQHECSIETMEFE